MERQLVTVDPKDVQDSEQEWKNQFDRSHSSYHGGDERVVPCGKEKRIPKGMEGHANWRSLPVVVTPTGTAEGVQLDGGGQQVSRSDDPVEVLKNVRELVGEMKKFVTSLATPVHRLMMSSPESPPVVGDTVSATAKKEEGRAKPVPNGAEGRESTNELAVRQGKVEEALSECNEMIRKMEESAEKVKEAARSYPIFSAPSNSAAGDTATVQTEETENAWIPTASPLSKLQQCVATVDAVVSEVRELCKQSEDPQSNHLLLAAADKQSQGEFVLKLNLQARNLFALQRILLEEIKNLKKHVSDHN